MPKSLAVFCDGTWNSWDDPSPTNVFKLRNLVLPAGPGGVRQAAYYDSGVGTRGAWVERAFDGATGWGLSENIRQAYRALVDNYETGDALYLFGFSRGAFTVRSLAGLIRNCGILRRDQRHLVEDAYNFYRDPDPSKRPDKPAAEAYRRDHAVEPATFIQFVGVWDTVGSLGNPLLRHDLINRTLRFHDVKLSSYVRNAFQALAIDEYRMQFQPAIWRQQRHAVSQAMRQAWFIGAHSDVGGGYAEPGLSNITLDWMARRAIACGLGIDENGLRLVLGGSFPASNSVPHDSHRGFYTWFPSSPRQIDLPADAGGERLPTNERLHYTVIERYRQDLGYRPVGLEGYMRRNPAVLEGDPRAGGMVEPPG